MELDDGESFMTTSLGVNDEGGAFLSHSVHDIRFQ